jgi:hypothetical protein
MPMRHRMPIDDPETGDWDSRYHHRICPHCGTKFRGRGSDWSHPHYCSERCQQDARNERRKAGAD